MLHSVTVWVVQLIERLGYAGLFGGLSLQATVAIENARLFAESQQRAAELATVNTVSQQLAGKLDLANLLELVGERRFAIVRALLCWGFDIVTLWAALHAAGGRAAEVIVDHFDLGPSQCHQPIAHGVLQRAALAVVQHLMSRGLAYVEDRLALGIEASGASRDQLLCLAVVTAYDDSPPTANLLAPVVVNLANGSAVQSVRYGAAYSHMHPLKPVVACS